MYMNININKSNTHSSVSHAEKIALSIMKTGLSRKIDFLEKLVRKGKIILPNGEWNEIWTDSYIEQMTIITQNLQVAYGDNWDLHFFVGGALNPNYNEDDAEEAAEEGEDYDIPEYLQNKKFYVYPKILYKHITITNSNNKTQEINDLVVMIPLDYNYNFSEFNFAIQTIQGTRYSYTYEHYQSSYTHSHLPKKDLSTFNNIGTTQSFCIGSGSEIGDIMIEINSNGFDENLFGLYLTMIDTVVRWESLEGVPHYKMETIVSKAGRQINIDFSTLRDYYGRFMDFAQTSYDAGHNFFDLNYVFNQGRYRIKEDSKLERTLNHFVSKYRNGSLMKDLLVKLDNETFYGFEQISIQTPEEITSHMKNNAGHYPETIICGKKVQFNVKAFTGKKIDIKEYFVYPKFKKYVTEQLESELYEKAVTSSAVRTQAELNNA